MLQALLAVVHIVWSGAGAPPGGTAQAPAIVWHERAVRRPAGATMLRVTDTGPTLDAAWSVTPGDAAILDETTSGTAIRASEFRGPFLLHATSAGGSATLAAFAYGALGIGCEMNLDNGVRIADDGVAQSSGTIAESDVYVTGHAPRADVPWLGCTGNFATARDAGDFRLHVPYGGRVYRAAAAHFAWFRAEDWRPDVTVVPALRPGDVLLFRTRLGGTVKLLCATPDGANGPYLTAGAGREFLDYRYLTAHHYQPHALFGAHDR